MSILTSLISFSTFGGNYNNADGFSFMSPAVLDRRDSRTEIVNKRQRLFSSSLASRTALSSWIRQDGEEEAMDDDDELDVSSLEIVLFGVGDLRTDDHGGLQRALTQIKKNEESHILPLVVLDDATLSNLPGVVTHSMDISDMLHHALTDLRQQLEREYQLPLYVIFDSIENENNYSSLLDALNRGVIQPLIDEESSFLSSSSRIRIHMCDLGRADNRMGYAPYGSLLKNKGLDGNGRVYVKPWSCPLWDFPWEDVKSLPDSYPEFAQLCKSKRAKPTRPCSRGDAITGKEREETDLVVARSAIDGLTSVSTEIPTAERICNWIQSKFEISDQRCQADHNTGLFATHWGGLDPQTVGESQVCETLRLYNEECQQDDQKFVSTVVLSIDRYSKRNIRSLEHASMVWNMRGEDIGKIDAMKSNGNYKGNSSFQVQTENIMAGELMTRFLAAPLWLGTISPRRVWYSCEQQDNVILGLLGDQNNDLKPTLQSMVEAREWHKLLAARNIESDPAYSSHPSKASGTSDLKYDYWRWHGFLCRYAKSSSTANEERREQLNKRTSGLLFVHGFGASGSQWQKTIHEVHSASVSDQTSSKDETHLVSLAPDLIGFGHSEKPAITYSGYTWEAYVGDFAREVGLFKNDWSNFVVGGNSIGGFTAMCSAANDATTSSTRTTPDGSIKQVVSGSGAPGTGRCSGVILMNPAGNIQTREQVETILTTVGSDVRLPSVAQVTASDALPPCK